MSSELHITPRRKFSPDQKFKIIKEQMTTKTSESDIRRSQVLGKKGFVNSTS